MPYHHAIKMKLFLKYKLSIIGIMVGAIGGYAYYYFVGCENGTCAIASHPFYSMAYRAFMGAVLFTGLKKENTDNKKIKKMKTIIDVLLLPNLKGATWRAV